MLTGLALLPDGRREDFRTIHVEGLITRARERSYSYYEQVARALAAIMVAGRGREVSKPCLTPEPASDLRKSPARQR